MTKCAWCKIPENLKKLMESCEHDPETYKELIKAAEFYQVYPEISGLSFGAVRPLMREKNKKVQQSAISEAAEEIKRRANIHHPNFSLARRRVTADRVREIIHEQHIKIEGTDAQREAMIRKQEETEKEILYTCPLCKGLITISLSKRNKIVSLRATEDAEDAYAYLAKRLGVSRSLLLSEILALKSRFPSLF